MTSKERAEYALGRVNRWLLAGNRDVATYHIQQSIIAAEKESAMRERESCLQVIREEIGEKEFNDPFSREGETIRRIVAKIKAK